jgi:hypothetical protein
MGVNGIDDHVQDWQGCVTGCVDHPPTIMRKITGYIGQLTNRITSDSPAQTRAPLPSPFPRTLPIVTDSRTEGSLTPINNTLRISDESTKRRPCALYAQFPVATADRL